MLPVTQLPTGTLEKPVLGGRFFYACDSAITAHGHSAACRKNLYKFIFLYKYYALSGCLSPHDRGVRYRLNLPVDGSVYEVSFDDWMYLMDEDTLINRSSMSKFGVEWGQVTLFFRRQ